MEHWTNFAVFRIGFPNAWGIFLAIYVLSIGVNGLTMIGAPFWVNQVFNGVALIVGIALARWMKTKQGRQTAEVDMEGGRKE